MLLRLGLVILLLAVGMAYSARAGKLTIPAVWTGGVLGMCIYLGAGFMGLGLLATFFGLGTAASAWRVADKRRLGLAEANKGRRTAGQVLVNAGLAGVLGLSAWLLPAHAPLARLMLAGGFAAATADTLASSWVISTAGATSISSPSGPTSAGSMALLVPRARCWGWRAARCWPVCTARPRVGTRLLSFCCWPVRRAT